MRPVCLVCFWILVALPLACSEKSTDAQSDGGADTPAEVDVAADTDGSVDATPDVRTDPYSIDVFDNVRISSVDEANAFTRTTSAPVDFGQQNAASATMIVDLATTCFPFESWSQPPPGHNFPADCDAFDRNFELVLDPGTEDEPPGIELMRAITPFGGPQHLEIDITDVFNGLPGEHMLQAHIATWADGSGQVSGSAGGWNVTVRIDVVPGPAPREVLAVQPLVNGSFGQAAIAQTHNVTVPEGTVKGEVQYRVTGHGGTLVEGDSACVGGAEEFCRRTHEIFIGGELASRVTPWRDDCAELCTLTHYGPVDSGFDYCLENPTGSIRSVEAPRANWCPGDLSPPFLFRDMALRTPGVTTFGFDVIDMPDVGSWRVSATYFAYGTF